MGEGESRKQVLHESLGGLVGSFVHRGGIDMESGVKGRRFFLGGGIP
jgi:hypothetical protein